MPVLDFTTAPSLYELEAILRYADDVNAACRVLLALGLALALAGCGGGSPPPLAVTCLTHRLPSGAFATRLTVTNRSGARTPAVVYGPALFWARYVHPVPVDVEVAILLPAGRRFTYIGFHLAAMKAGGTRRLLLHLSPHARGTHIAVTNRRIIHSKDLSPLRDNACTIGVKR